MSRMSEIALRMNPSAKKKCPYERYTGREPSTRKRNSTSNRTRGRGRRIRTRLNHTCARKSKRQQTQRRISETKRGTPRTE